MRLDGDAASLDSLDVLRHCVDRDSRHFYPIAGHVPGAWHLPDSEGPAEPFALNCLHGCETGLARALQPIGHREIEMLRITVQENGSLWRLHLAGKLAGAWVAETEKTWRSAPVSGRRLEIDMTDVTCIDEAGRRLLQAMNQAGACLIAEGVAMKALVEELTGEPARRRSDSHL